MPIRSLQEDQDKNINEHNHQEIRTLCEHFQIPESYLTTDPRCLDDMRRMRAKEIDTHTNHKIMLQQRRDAMSKLNDVERALLGLI